MSKVTLKANVTKDGKGFFSNTAVYPDISGDPLAYLLSVAKRASDAIAKHHNGGPFAIELSGDVDGTAFPGVSVTGVSVADFHAYQRAQTHLQLEMIDNSEAANKKAGKL
jgi:hypothetical protein